MIKTWVTEIEAIHPFDGVLKKWAGPEVPGITIKDAQDYCENNSLGYCRVIGELIAEIPCKENTFEPDFKNLIDYENTRNN